MTNIFTDGQRYNTGMLYHPLPMHMAQVLISYETDPEQKTR